MIYSIHVIQQLPPSIYRLYSNCCINNGNVLTALWFLSGNIWKRKLKIKLYEIWEFDRSFNIALSFTDNLAYNMKSFFFVLLHNQ